MQSGQIPEGHIGFDGVVAGSAAEALDAPHPPISQLAALQSDLARRDFALADMADRLETARIDGDRARSLAERRAAELAILTDLLEERRKEAETLQRALAMWREQAQDAKTEVSRLEAELTALRASRSWRITSPLRRLEHRLRWIRRRLASGGRETD